MCYVPLLLNLTPYPKSSSFVFRVKSNTLKFILPDNYTIKRSHCQSLFKASIDPD